MNEYQIMTPVMMFLSVLGTLSVQWMRREKTESEAEKTESEAEEIKAHTVVMLYKTIAQMSAGIEDQAKATQDQAKATIEYIKELDTSKRDIWRLEGAIILRDRQDNERLGQIKSLESRLAVVTKANADLETKVASLTQSKNALESQVAGLERSSSDKDAQIELMRGRIAALETERDDLNKQIEAKESTGDNGTGNEEEGPVTEKSVTKQPEVDPQDIPGGT